eukprot:TRINITY_DN3359_c0_g1_i1.p1 TRINITY_DN3359_c0_g1~~TRINITY_DN3359_c0_g1_i1.p1  ORF type:complete len:276 (+),score=67.76 TRINITY_DN3359_c0_g1_i1:996-1823(+)
MEQLWAILADPNGFHYVPGKTVLSEWWQPVSVSVGYLVLIFSIQTIMKNFKPFNLKWVSAVHNLNLFIISVVCFVGMVYGLYEKLSRHSWGWETLFCDAKNIETNRGPLFYWIYVFYLSKIYELLDTVILVLKKKQLIFLHVYHHAATLLLVWWCLHLNIPVQWIACVLNALVHIPMYYYYFVTTFGMSPWWKKYLTQLQIIQFVTVNLVHGYAYYWHYYIAHNCTSFDGWGNQVGGGIIWSYLFLFLHFYYNTYRAGRATRAANAAKATAKKID